MLLSLYVFIAGFAFVLQMHRAAPIPLSYFSDKDLTHFVRTPLHTPCSARYSVLHLFVVLSGGNIAFLREDGGTRSVTEGARATLDSRVRRSSNRSPTKKHPMGVFHKAGFTCRKNKRSTDDLFELLFTRLALQGIVYYTFSLYCRAAT